MKRWQEERNYKRIRDDNGNIVANIITVDGIDVEVTDEVFRAYSSIDRRERYLIQDTAKDRVLSLERLLEEDVLLEYLCRDFENSSEDAYFTQIEMERKETLSERLREALRLLSSEDRELIDEIFSQQKSLGAIAKSKGTSYQAVQQRRDRILGQLKKFLKNS